MDKLNSCTHKPTVQSLMVQKFTHEVEVTQLTAKTQQRLTKAAMPDRKYECRFAAQTICVMLQHLQKRKLTKPAMQDFN